MRNIGCFGYWNDIGAMLAQAAAGGGVVILASSYYRRLRTA
jgi:hypothetical protein